MLYYKGLLGGRRQVDRAYPGVLGRRVPVGGAYLYLDQRGPEGGAYLYSGG